jgi:hypothetical protein
MFLAPPFELAPAAFTQEPGQLPGTRFFASSPHNFELRKFLLQKNKGSA